MGQEEKTVDVSETVADFYLMTRVSTSTMVGGFKNIYNLKLIWQQDIL